MRLGELELAVMEYVWSRGGDVTVPDVHGHIARSRDLAYTTVMTIMGRLHEKGLLHRSEERRPYVYRQAVTRDDYFAELMAGVLRDLKDRRGVLARFVERIGPRDAELLRELAARPRPRKR